MHSENLYKAKEASYLEKGSEESKIVTNERWRWDNRLSHWNESYRHGDVHNIQNVDTPKWSHNHNAHRVVSNNPSNRAPP